MNGIGGGWDETNEKNFQYGWVGSGGGWGGYSMGAERTGDGVWGAKDQSLFLQAVPWRPREKKGRLKENGISATVLRKDSKFGSLYTLERFYSHPGWAYLNVGLESETSWLLQWNAVKPCIKQLELWFSEPSIMWVRNYVNIRCVMCFRYRIGAQIVTS